MPLPINISDLINRRVVENARVEYKGDWNPEPILHSICALTQTCNTTPVQQKR